MTLCGSCADFDIQSFREAPYQTRGYQFSDVERAVREQDCQFCRLLFDIAISIDAAVQASNSKKPTWIHLRMSENAYRRKESKSLPLHFNRMDVTLSDRHALFTHDKSGETAWQQEGVQCRLLADPGMSIAFNTHHLR